MNQPQQPPQTNYRLLAPHPHLQSLLSQHPPPQSLYSICRIFQQTNITNNYPNPKQLTSQIDCLCNEILKLNTSQILLQNINKDQEIENVFKKSLFQSKEDHDVVVFSGQNIGKMYRDCIGKYFHYFLHYTTIKNITKLAVIFYKLLDLQMLDYKIVNYFFLHLILSHENLVTNRDIKITKACLRSVYQKSLLTLNPTQPTSQSPIRNPHLYPSPTNPPTLTQLTYLLYFGNNSRHKSNQPHLQTDTKIITHLFQNQIKLCQNILALRNQFPQYCILECDRNVGSLGQCIVDSFFMKSVLRVYLDFRLSAEVRNKVYWVVQVMVGFGINVQIVKNMIKMLEIVDSEDIKDKWKNMFVLLKTALPKRKSQPNQLHSQVSQTSPKKSQDPLAYHSYISPNSPISPAKQPALLPPPQLPKDTLLFQSKNSYIKHTLQHEFSGFYLQFRSYRTHDQYLLFKLRNNQNQIWVMVRHIQMFHFQISGLRLQDKNPIQMNKIEIEWNPFQKHGIEVVVQEDHILVKVLEQVDDDEAEENTNKWVTFLSIKNIRPKDIILGTNNLEIPCYITNIQKFKVYYCQGKGSLNYILHSKNNLREMSRQVSIQTKANLIEILYKLGDIDLFFLVTSHLIRKVQDNQTLNIMLKEVIDFLEELILVKGVHGVKLAEKDKEKRFYNVRCLVWLASKYKRNPDTILEIFRLLSIRGVKKPLQSLQILSNMGLWKQIPQKLHYKLVDKIKQTCGQLNINNSNEISQIMKKIMLDFMIFYKNNQLLSENLQHQYLLKHSQILKLVYDIITTQNFVTIINFVEFLHKILYILLDRTKNSDYIDTCLGFQIALLAYRLVRFARQIHFQPNKQKLQTDLKKITKIAKMGLTSPKSVSIPLLPSQQVHFNHEKDQQLYIYKLQQALAWSNQICYCLNNQLIHSDQQIKFYDWQWDEKSSLTMSSVFSLGRKGINHPQKKLRKVGQSQILKLCQKTQMGIMSYNKDIFNVLSLNELSPQKWQIFWDLNLFDRKISIQRIINTIQFGHFDRIMWNDERIKYILERSFELVVNGVSLKLPQKLLESMKAKNVDSIHNCLLGIYLQICQDKTAIEKQKCAEKIMYITALLPDSLFTNTQLLREQLRKQKRNLKVIQLVQKHLVLKQLANQGFKLMKQMKFSENRQLTSTISAFGQASSVLGIGDKDKIESFKLNSSSDTLEADSKKSNPARKNSQQINTFYVLDNVQFQDSFYQMPQSSAPQTISTEMIKDSLQHVRLLASPSQIQAFYKVSSLAQSKKDANQQIQGHITNFNLNIDAIIQILDDSNSQAKNNKIGQLQNYLYFIQKQLYAFSKRIISQYLFTEIKKIKVDEQVVKSKRKKSFKSANNYKFKEVCEEMLEQFLKDRRKSVFKMQNLWLSVQKNNKDFWQIFFKSQKKNQSVDNTCNALKLRGLIKVDHQKRQIQLPKNMTTISNKFSISGDSDKDEQHTVNESAIFEEAAIYQQQQLSQSDKQDNAKQGMHINDKFMLEQIVKNKKKKRKNQFAVLYITTTTIYQGVIICQNTHIRFIEDTVPDTNFYEIICANQNQQRTVYQIQKRRQQFQLNLNEKSTIIPKKYLYYDAAVQVYSQKNTSFFVFRKSSRRQLFLKLYQHLKGTIINESELIHAVNRQTERWVNGDISNFTYLMHLNDLAGRSFNDMSQYYIFPWVITNFKAQKFNKKFVKNQSNYRDLSKPVGALNPKRFQELQLRFKQSTKYQQTQSYLYGSYCSNPAIVCNFLVRLQPFSMHHYLLQSKQFDLADRIFYSISNQFSACYLNVGDYKELIPQFYSCPQFLRNRNKYKFGQKQNKQIVNNVELPEWAYYQFGQKRSKTIEIKLQSVLPEEQFIFRMRKCLQSDYVTMNLNFWIDLIFGPYNRKQKAMQRNNLYLSSIYKSDSKNKKDSMLIFYKQFGQMPRDVFQREHKSYKNSRTYYKLSNSQIQLVSSLNSGKSSSKKQYYTDSKYFVCWDEHSLSIIDIKNKSGLLQKTQNTLTQIQLKNEYLTQLKILSIENPLDENKKTQFIVYLKLGKLIFRQISISTFRKKLEIKEEKESFYDSDNVFSLLEVYQQQKLIILASSNAIRIYQYCIQTNSLQKSSQFSLPFARHSAPSSTLKYVLSKKHELRLTPKFQLTQHKSQIQYMKICQSYGLLASIDSNRKVYILKIHAKQQIQVIQYFRLKKLTNCEDIVQVQMHQMGYFIVLTRLNNVHVYNLMGDHVGVFVGGSVREIRARMYRKMESSIQFNKNLDHLKTGVDKQENRNRKKSDNDMPTQKIIGYQLEQSDPDSFNPSIILQQNQKLPTSIASESLIKSQPQPPQQHITCIRIWNHESGQIIFGTNLGNVYRLDLFMFEDCQNVDFSRTVARDRKKMGKSGLLPIEFVSVNRIGRHWQCWVASEQELFKIESEDYRNADKRNEEYKKKCVIQ